MELNLFPPSLYKYYPPKNWDFIFKQWTIRFTPMNEFNDPFEALPKLNFCIKETHNKIYLDIVTKLLLRRFMPQIYSLDFSSFLDEYYTFMNDRIIREKYYQDSYREKFHKNFTMLCGAFCLTESDDNMLMWSHYADSHKGFVIEFDAEHIHSSVIHGKQSLMFNKIVYVQDRPEIDMYDLWNRGNDTDMYVTALKYFYSKSDRWKYEKEWRTVIKFHETERQNNNFGVVSIDQRAIKSVTFGISMSDSEVNKKYKEIKSDEKCAHISLRKAIQHEKEYKIIINNLD
ncbi:MAG: DUF2971 domain-containing protein [Desulfovibrio desulfuricans]|nr:DUF2971 domain-containing protein [Desulfovibrio desulfuricans]